VLLLLNAVWSWVVMFYYEVKATFAVIFHTNRMLRGFICLGSNIITVAKQAAKFGEILTTTVTKLFHHQN
jgi:hypothetical protein